MKMDYLTDGHVHTRLCHHATGEMEDYVLAGISRGLRKIVFLEHFEVGINYVESTWLTEDDFHYYRQEGERLRKEFRGQIEVGLGVEVGFNPDCVKEIDKFLASYPWDRIGVSYHFYKRDGRHHNMVSRMPRNLSPLEQVGIDKVVTEYFQTLKTAVEVLPGTVLCHLDAVLRHHPDTMLKESHDQQIEELLQAVRAKKMAIEVNTSGYEHRDRPYPDFPYIRRAVELGIPLAPGSDAHRPEQVGRFFERLPEIFGC